MAQQIGVCPHCLRTKPIAIISGRNMGCDDCKKREEASKKRSQPKK